MLSSVWLHRFYLEHYGEIKKNSALSYVIFIVQFPIDWHEAFEVKEYEKFAVVTIDCAIRPIANYMQR